MSQEDNQNASYRRFLLNKPSISLHVERVKHTLAFAHQGSVMLLTQDHTSQAYYIACFNGRSLLLAG